MGKQYDDCYTIPTIKRPPSPVARGEMSAKGIARLFFIQPGTTINGKK